VQLQSHHNHACLIDSDPQQREECTHSSYLDCETKRENNKAEDASNSTTVTNLNGQLGELGLQHRFLQKQTHTDGHAHTYIYRHRHIQTDTHRQTDTHAHVYRHTHTHTHTQSHRDNQQRVSDKYTMLSTRRRTSRNVCIKIYRCVCRYIIFQSASSLENDTHYDYQNDDNFI
jgi:hypothetical protein